MDEADLFEGEAPAGTTASEVFVEPQQTAVRVEPMEGLVAVYLRTAERRGLRTCWYMEPEVAREVMEDLREVLIDIEDAESGRED